MKRICVFCGSSSGLQKEYYWAAQQLGHLLVKNNIGLVYGGGKVGLMGKIAQTVMQGGGEVIGIIPKDLADKEVAFTMLSDLRVVDSMHSRKALMEELSDGFIALPGGLGTIEEFFEMLTWGQLGIHQKPCGLLNVKGYFNQLIGFINHIVDEQFVEKEHRAMILMDQTPEGLLQQFFSYEHPTTDKAQWALEAEKAHARSN